MKGLESRILNDPTFYLVLESNRISICFKEDNSVLPFLLAENAELIDYKIFVLKRDPAARHTYRSHPKGRVS